MLSSLLAGLLAGGIHVASGPDHLAALGPLAASARGRGWRAGIRWGIGHSAGVAIVAVVALLLREVLPLERMAHRAEQFVGLVLIVIGMFAIRAAVRYRAHSHEHVHDGEQHAHFHVHARGVEHDRTGGHRHESAALAVGVLHGLAGSAHFLGVLPALALPSRAAAVAYITGFMVGTVLTMSAFGALIDATVGRPGARGERLYRGALGTLGAVAIAVGVWWALR